MGTWSLRVRAGDIKFQGEVQADGLRRLRIRDSWGLA